jgi:hypothetical protein
MSADRTEAEFVAAFEDTSLPEAAFRHRDHVRLAWIYLRETPVPEALARFAEGLKRFAAAKGKAGLYHETITFAYLLLINERVERSGRGSSFDDFAEANPDLLVWRPSILASYYKEETLGSLLARRTFVLPDRVAPAQAARAGGRQDPQGFRPARRASRSSWRGSL